MPENSARLQSLQEHVAGRFEQSEVRGSGTAAFLYVQHDGRAVEVSRSEAGWWIEFWDKSAEDDAAAATEQTVATDEEAIEALCRWLEV